MEQQPPKQRWTLWETTRIYNESKSISVYENSQQQVVICRYNCVKIGSMNQWSAKSTYLKTISVQQSELFSLATELEPQTCSLDEGQRLCFSNLQETSAKQ